jgi:hypothetical protein
MLRLAVIAVAVLTGCGARSELIAPDLGDTGTGGSDPGERSCLPTCYIGHDCCEGGCGGPTVPLESPCCVCLPGEVSSADCPALECGGDP